MDIQVTKLFPVAYIEMPRPSEEAEGEEPPRPIPRCEAEERDARDQWQQKRANEELRLREEWEKKVSGLEGLAENLERTAGRWVLPEDGKLQASITIVSLIGVLLDYPPDEVEDLLEELDDADDLSSLVKGLSPTNAGWLAHLIRKKCLDMKDRIGETIQRELEVRDRGRLPPLYELTIRLEQKSCPPREVRNFRVIRFKDYRTARRPARRTGQMTVWDVLSLGEDSLQEGRRFLVSLHVLIGDCPTANRLLLEQVTNVVPCQPTAWSHHEAEEEAYFKTRRDSRWTSLPLETATRNVES